MFRWKRLLAAVLLVAVGAYAVVLAFLYFDQRQMIYFPPAADTAIPDPAGPAVEVVTIETADGERLNAFWRPAEPGRPTFLFFGGNADSIALQTGRWSRIAEAGAGFLAVAYRGYSGSTGQPTEAGLHADGAAAYTWLAQRVAAGDIVIHGFSLGSGVAVKLAAEREAGALVLEAPFTASVDVGSETYPWVPVGLLMKDQYRSRDWISDVDEPLLILHGDADTVIPFHHGQMLFDMAGEPKTFVRMAGSDHNTLIRDGAYDHIWRFLGVTLVPGAD
jgi:fermentation-respiration switch protein FrsA (DUF1100 family)